MAGQIFKWLMALVVMVYVPLLLESCRGLRKTDFKHSEEYMKERVESIYAEVMLFYNRLNSLRQSEGLQPTKWPDFDRLYCSADWNERVADVLSVDARCQDGEGFFVWNYWTCSQTFGFMYASDIEVIDKTGNQGTVALTLHNGDMAVPVLLNMIFERGDWYIDEITNNWNRHPDYPYFEWKHEMNSYMGVG